MSGAPLHAAFAARSRALLAIFVVLLAIWTGVFGAGAYHRLQSLDAPIGYTGDVVAMYGMRGLGSAGLPFASRMSAPFNHALRRFPNAVQCYAFSMECTVLRITGKFTRDPIRIVNIYYFLVYFLCGLIALYSLRRFGIGWIMATAGAILFALLPFHFMRNVNHLTVSNYALIPLFFLVCAWIHDRGMAVGNGSGVLPGRLATPHIAFVLLLSLTWGLTNDYYAFMFLLFAWFAALLAGNHYRNLRPLWAAALVTLGLMASFVIRRALVRWSWGPFAGTTFGTFQLTAYGQDELYPLKLIQMILPGPENRFHLLRHMNHVYSAAHPLVNENRWDALGALLAIAMLVLLAGALLAGVKQDARGRFLGKNLLLAIFLGAMGGIGTIISELSWSLLGPRFPLSQARAWNRVYVFLAFVVIVFMATHADRWLRALREHTSHADKFGLLGRAAVAAVVIVTATAMYEQIPPVSKGWLRDSNAQYLTDKTFFGKLDNHYARDYRVFYWPAMRPWGGTYGSINYTVAYRPLIASQKLVTSYGAAPNTTAARWLDATAAQPPALMLRTLCTAKFDGVLVYKYALNASNQALVQYLQARSPPLEADANYAYYPAPACNR